MFGNSYQVIQKHKIFAVIRDSSEERAIKSIYALMSGGIKIIEISMLCTEAISIISMLHKSGVYVGAGTVMDKNMADRVIKAGAQYIVSPHIDETVIKTALDSNILVISGCVTPNEIVRANKLGANIIKIFPAHGFGGVNYLKSLIEIFPDIWFMPTGGVSIANIADYFNVGVMAVGMSSALLPKDLIDNKKYDDITKLAHKYVSLLENRN